jgi:hypothetical protein
VTSAGRGRQDVTSEVKVTRRSRSQTLVFSHPSDVQKREITAGFVRHLWLFGTAF